MNAVPHLSPAEQTRTIAMLVAVQFLHMVDFIVIMPLGPLLMHDFAVSPRVFALLVAVYSVGAALGGLLGALFVDRFDRRRALLALLCGFAVATFVCGTSSSFAALLLGRMAAGLCGGSMEALCFTIVGDGVPEDRRASATGKLMAGIALAAIVGVPAGLVLSAWFDWRAPFLLVAALAAVVLAGGCRLLSPMTAHRAEAVVESAWAGFVHVLRFANHRRALACTAALMFATFSIPPYLASYYVLNLGVSEAHLPVYYAISGTFAVLTAPLIGRLADRHGKRRVFTVVALAAMAPMLAVTHLPPVHPALVALAGTCLFMCITGCYAVSGAIVASSAHPAYRGRFMSLDTTCEQIGMAATTLLTGLLVGVDADGRLTGFGTVGFVAVGASLVAMVLFRRLAAAPVSAMREAAA